MSDSIRVLIADDHPLLRDGLASIIACQPDMVVAGQAASGREAIQRYAELKPDVMLLDLRLPDMTGIDAMIAVRGDFHDARIIMLTTFGGDVEIRRALEAGARAYLLKSTPPKELLDTIRRVHSGKKGIPTDIAAHLAEHYGDEQLTDREVDVLKQLGGGNRNCDIARKLFIAEETVKVHIKHIMEKLGATDRTLAVVIAARRGIIQL